MALFNNNFGVNLDGHPYIIYFDDAGSMWSLSVTDFGITEEAPAGTFSLDGTQDVTIWQGQVLLIIDPVTGYFSWDPQASPAFVSLNGSPVTLVGNTLAVYAGRVWIFNNRLITFSAP